MTSSSFQTSRLKTVSKTPPLSFSFSIYLCVCVFVHALVLLFGCVSTSVVWFFFLSRLACLYSGRECVFFRVSQYPRLPHLLLAQVLSGELQQSYGSADRCVGLVVVVVEVGGGVSLSPLTLSVCVYICLSLSLCCSCTSHHHWDIIALWFICINIKILW